VNKKRKLKVPSVKQQKYLFTAFPFAVFERKLYRRILGPVYDNEKEKWRILTNKEIYATCYNRDNKFK
jgi:hypothetical protein